MEGNRLAKVLWHAVVVYRYTVSPEGPLGLSQPNQLKDDKGVFHHTARGLLTFHQ